MSYSSQLSAHYLEVARAPISVGSFAGEDVRFSNEYEALESELNKAQSMHVQGQLDWLKVRDQSENLLRNLSKDLRVGAWLAWALYQRESFHGLLAGLELLHHLCVHHWAEVHPAKARTRSAPMGWLIPRIEQVLNDNVSVDEQSPLFSRLVEILEDLDAVFTQHMGDDAPLLLPISRRLKNMAQRATDNLPNAGAGAVGAAVQQVKQAATQLFAPSAVISDERDAHKSLRLQQESARALCAWWLSQKPCDLRALRLNRTMLWLPIETLPERNSDQITALRGLSADRLKGYQDKFDQGSYADLLLELEASLAKAPFWFDGQRLVWECLQGMSAETAMREVELHFAQLIQRLPGVIELRFHDGAPFADQATRAWITASVMPRLQAASAPRKVEIADTQPVWEFALENASSVLRKDGLRAGVQFLKQGMHSAQGGRARFFWQLALARLCFTARKYELAKTQLETLDKTLQDSGIDAWEPELALEVLHLLHSCFDLLPQDHGARQRKEAVHRRLCHLDLEVLLE
jgi:type VI secretion system protein VasJ